MVFKSSRSRWRSRKDIAAVAITLAFLASVAAASASPSVPIGPPPNPTAVTQGSSPTTDAQTTESAVALSSTCSVGYRYAGYFFSGYPATGSNGHVRLLWNTTTLHSGHMAGYLGVSNTVATYWIQAGLSRIQGDSHISKYIEYNTPSTYQFVDKGTASAGTLYNAYIYHVASGSWNASIGGSGLTDNVTLSGMTTTDFFGESYTATSGTCNVMDINFSNSFVATSNPDMSIYSTSPYTVDSITSNGWRSHGA